MAWATQIKGFDQVITNLNREIKLIKGRSRGGLIHASNLIRTDTAHTTPREYSNLLASWFTVTDEGKATDPLAVSGNFSKNKRKNINASVFKSQYSSAVSESSGLAKANSAKGPFLIMGYGVNYAAPVHEMMERFPGVQWTNPQTESKWFENSFKRNKDRILKIIADNARIKG
jgi:hypothetical protein